MELPSFVKLPNFVEISAGAINDIEEAAKTMGTPERIAIVYDKDLLDYAKIIQHQFQGALFTPDGYRKSDLKEFASKLENYDFILGVGGGRTIDAAKYSAHLSETNWISVPTILSHDGVVSNRAAIQNDSGEKVSVDAVEPYGVIVDTEVIRSAPKKYTMAGAADVISNISSVADWQLAQEMGEHYQTTTAELALTSSRSVINHLDEIAERTDHGLYVLTWSLIISGMAMNIYGTSRPGSGSEHNYSHALEHLNSPIIHGEQCALGTIITEYLRGRDFKQVYDYFQTLGIPTTVEELQKNYDIDIQLLLDALVLAKDIRGYERYTILDRDAEENGPIDHKRAEDILKNVEII